LLILGTFSVLSSLFSQNYEPDFFPIGVWSVRGDFRPVEEFLFNVETAAEFHHTSFQNLKSQGFNSVFLSYDPIGYTLDTILDIAEANDMRVISNMQHLHQVISQSNDTGVTSADIIEAIENDSIARLKQSPAVLGYYLYDEPLPGWIDFDVLENARNILTQITADAPHPILSCWNDEQYMTYIDSYLNLDVLMMDAYPFEDGDAYGDVSDFMPSYFYDGEDPMPFSDYVNSVRANHCDNEERPMWVVLQAFGDMEVPENGGYWRQVYPKEIRLQVYLALMQGAKGIWYFLYESEFPYLLGLLDVSGQPTQRLDEVVAINQEINQISSLLLKLKVESVQSSLMVTEGEAKLHYHVDNGKKYIFCVNTNVESGSVPQVSIDKGAVGYQVLSVIDRITGSTVAFEDGGDHWLITPELLPAGGVLLELSDETASTGESLRELISVSPNPVNSTIHIQHPNVPVQAYRITGLTGKTVKSGILPAGVTSLDVRDLEGGLYFLILRTDSGEVAFKFVKE
jgi:hypothetical protein